MELNLMSRVETAIAEIQVTNVCHFILVLKIHTDVWTALAFYH